MRRLSKRTLTKRITYSLIIIGTIGGYIPYILSLLDKEPVEELGIAWVTGIVGVALGYFVRGFKDTQAEKQHDLEVREFERGIDDVSEY